MPPPPSDSGGLAFTKVGHYFVYGCIGPLVVSAVSSRRLGVPLTDRSLPWQAIYPTFIVFLIALNQSPIDNGGLSRVYQGCDAGHWAEEGTGSAIVFPHHTFQSSGDVDMGRVGEGVCRSTSSLAILSMTDSEGQVKAAGSMLV